MKKYDIYIGLDPGVSGGFCILEGRKSPKIYKMPTRKIEVNKKKKNRYDLEKIVSILQQYSGKNVLFSQEKVSAMTGQGVTSSFGFGKSSGFTEGIAIALGFDFQEISPQTWKKYFPELNTPEIQLLRGESKQIRQEIKELEDKSKELKDKSIKKENNKIIKTLEKQKDRLYRQIKTKAKAKARSLVSNMYSKLADSLVAVNTDGIAESVLIAKYAKDNFK